MQESPNAVFNRTKQFKGTEDVYARMNAHVKAGFCSSSSFAPAKFSKSVN